MSPRALFLCLPCLAFAIGGACKKKAAATTRPDATPEAVAEFPLGESLVFEDEESLFRVELPGTPTESEETDDDPDSLVVRHSAQFRNGESELLVMWNEVLDAPEDPAEQLALLQEVAGGWAESGLKLESNEPASLGPCTARQLRGTLEKQPVEGKLAICDQTLIQIVASGTYLDDALRVFDSFEWLR